jgi:serine/threonine protein kinase/tetratricopeptide (TPR) repeat protein
MIIPRSKSFAIHESHNGLHDATLGRLIEELTCKVQAGQPVDLQAYIQAYPEHAEELEQMFGAVRRLAALGAAEAEREARYAIGAALPLGSAGGSSLGELGDFRLLREIGRGGMGIVYEAEQISLRRRVALKVLPLAAALDGKQLQRFRIEAQAAACLHHTHIVPVHAVGCERGVHYYAMQFIEGRSLAQLIKELLSREELESAHQLSGGVEPHSASRSSTTVAGRDNAAQAAVSEAMPPASRSEPAPALTTRGFRTAPGLSPSIRNREYIQTVAQFGVQVAEALDHAHARGILHRDIKPGNLLLDELGQLWVADFGLAQFQDNPCLTLTGDIVGTLRYMSPESAAGGKRLAIDGRTDIYSLGVTLYELLTLRPAVDGGDRPEILRKIVEEEPAPPRRYNAMVPRDLETILMKATAKEPGARYTTAKSLADDLRRFLEDKPVLARRPRPLDWAAKWSRRHRSVVAAGAAGLLMAVLIAAGSTGWIVRDRTARLAMTEREVTRALDEAAIYQAQVKWPEALEASKRAEGILAAGGGSELHRRVREVRNDVEMVLRLEELWMPHWGRTWGDRYDRRLAVGYATAFREYGIDVGALEPSEAAGRIRARTIRLELALALDAWACVQLRMASPTADATARRLLAVASAADPDEWRNQMRTAMEQRDSKALNKVAGLAQFNNLPVHTLSLLVSSNSLDSERAEFLLRPAQQAHPDDYLINFQLAWTLQHRPRDEQLDEAIRFYTAALALRPHNAAAWHWLADALRTRGTTQEQIACERKAIALDPDYLPPYIDLSNALEAQGKRDEAIAVLRKAADSRSTDPQDLNNVSWFLTTSPSCELHDARRAVELAQKAVELAPEVGDYWNTLGAAQYRAGSWQSAIDALERSMALRRGGDSFDWFFLAMARWQLGEHDKARVWYERAVQWLGNSAPYDNELRRFRAEAEQLLTSHESARSVTKDGPH